MELGALLPLGDIGGEPAVLREYAQTAESIGYHFIEAPDHVLGANPAGRTPTAPEPVSTKIRSYCSAISPGCARSSASRPGS